MCFTYKSIWFTTSASFIVKVSDKGIISFQVLLQATSLHKRATKFPTFTSDLFHSILIYTLEFLAEQNPAIKIFYITNYKITLC